MKEETEREEAIVKAIAELRASQPLIKAIRRQHGIEIEVEGIDAEMIAEAMLDTINLLEAVPGYASKEAKDNQRKRAFAVSTQVSNRRKGS